MAEEKSKYIKELFPTIPNSIPMIPKILGFRFWAYVKKYIQSGLNWIHSHNPAYSTEILIGLQLCNQFKN